MSSQEDYSKDKGSLGEVNQTALLVEDPIEHVIHPIFKGGDQGLHNEQEGRIYPEMERF